MLTTAKILFVSFTLFVLTGCTYKMINFTTISTKKVQMPPVAGGVRVEGQDCVWVVLFPIGIPDMSEAIDMAIETAGPEYDALVNGVVYLLQHSFIFGKNCYLVEGTPVNTKKTVSMSSLAGKELLFHSRRGISIPLS